MSTHRNEILILAGHSDPVFAPLPPEPFEAYPERTVAEITDFVIFIEVLGVRRPADVGSASLSPHPRPDITPDLDAISLVRLSTQTDGNIASVVCNDWKLAIISP